MKLRCSSNGISNNIIFRSCGREARASAVIWKS